jgi:hypothetical protein
VGVWVGEGVIVSEGRGEGEAGTGVTVPTCKGSGVTVIVAVTGWQAVRKPPKTNKSEEYNQNRLILNEAALIHKNFISTHFSQALAWFNWSISS